MRLVPLLLLTLLTGSCVESPWEDPGEDVLPQDPPRSDSGEHNLSEAATTLSLEAGSTSEGSTGASLTINLSPQTGQDGAVEAGSRPEDAEAAAPVVPEAALMSANRADAGPDADLTDSCDVPTNGVCNPIEQCGCHPQEGCYYRGNSTDAFICATAGDIEAFNRCHNANDCAAGLVCVDNLCAPTCVFDEDCGNTQDKCVVVGELDETVPGIRVCERQCASLLDTESCGEGARCSRVGTSVYCRAYEAEIVGTRVTDAGITEDVFNEMHAALGEACETDNSCAYPYVCSQGLCAAACESNADCTEYNSAECGTDTAGFGVCNASCQLVPEAGDECTMLPVNCGCPSEQSCKTGPLPTGGQTNRYLCLDNGPQELFDWCNTSNQCADGLSCLGGLCRPLCNPEADDPCPGNLGECVAHSIATDRVISACVGSCDPVTPAEDTSEPFAPCGEGSYCHHGAPNVTSRCVQENITHVPVGKGEGCAQHNDCTNGLVCVAACGGCPKSCLPLCRTDADCDGTETCRGNILSQPAYGTDEEDIIDVCL